LLSLHSSALEEMRTHLAFDFPRLDSSTTNKKPK